MDYDTGRWSELLSSTLKNDQKENLVDYMDTQAQAQQYIENTVGSYYQMIKKVPYILRYTDGTTQNGTNVIAGVNSYSAFNNLLSICGMSILAVVLLCIKYGFLSESGKK